MRFENGDTQAGPNPSGGRRRRRGPVGTNKKAGVAAPPTRGQFMRTLALLDAALRVWESQHKCRRASAWQRGS